MYTINTLDPISQHSFYLLKQIILLMLISINIIFHSIIHNHWPIIILITKQIPDIFIQFNNLLTKVCYRFFREDFIRKFFYSVKTILRPNKSIFNQMYIYFLFFLLISRERIWQKVNFFTLQSVKYALRTQWTNELNKWITLKI